MSGPTVRNPLADLVHDLLPLRALPRVAVIAPLGGVARVLVLRAQVQTVLVDQGRALPRRAPQFRARRIQTREKARQ